MMTKNIIVVPLENDKETLELCYSLQTIDKERKIMVMVEEFDREFSELSRSLVRFRPTLIIGIRLPKKDGIRQNSTAYYLKGCEKSKKFAEIIQEEMKESLYTEKKKPKNRSRRMKGFDALWQTRFPSVIIEPYNQDVEKNKEHSLGLASYCIERFIKRTLEV